MKITQKSKYIKRLFLLYLYSVSKNTTKKKTPKMIKEDSLRSITETADKDFSVLDGAVRSVKQPNEAIAIISNMRFF